MGTSSGRKLRSGKWQSGPSFNFDAMLERASMPTEYPKSAPEGIDDEDDRVDADEDDKN